MAAVAVFAPSPMLTVTIEEHPGDAEIHVHAGGQGVWQARMLHRLGVSVVLCCALLGETGRVTGHLLDDEQLPFTGVVRDGRGAAYVHDRRSGGRRVIASTEGDTLGRHELDELYGVVLKEGLTAGLVILSGPSGDDALPADTYRRLAADLRRAGVTVVADLSGDRLDAALAGGVDLLKVSLDEMQEHTGESGEVPGLLDAMRTYRARGAQTVVVSRGAGSVLLLDEHGAVEATPPLLDAVDHRGGGDSLTAGMCAALARGEAPREALSLGAAAGAVNVTRHGLGSGDAATIVQWREGVRIQEIDGLVRSEEPAPPAHTSPDALASQMRPDAGVEP